MAPNSTLNPLLICIHDPKETFPSVLQGSSPHMKKRFRNRTESLRIEESIILLNEFIALAKHILREVQSDHSWVCPRFCKLPSKQATATADIKKDTTSNGLKIVLSHLKLTMPADPKRDMHKRVKSWRSLLDEQSSNCDDLNKSFVATEKQYAQHTYCLKCINYSIIGKTFLTRHAVKQWCRRWSYPAEKHLYIKTRETTPIKVLSPPSLIKKWDKWTPEQLSSSGLLFTIFFCPCNYSEVQEDVFAGKWLVALWTLESRPINCWPGACIYNPKEHKCQSSQKHLLERWAEMY